MLDTCICSYIMREQPESVLLKLQQVVAEQNRVVVSAITYAEMRFGAIGKKSSPKHNKLVGAFVARLDAVLPWDIAAVDATAVIKKKRLAAEAGTPIGTNDQAISGHAIATNCLLVTNNVREFSRVKDLSFEGWVS